MASRANAPRSSSIEFVKGSNNPADMFTKCLGSGLYHQYRSMLGFEVVQGVHCVGETAIETFDSSEPFHSLSCISLRFCPCCGEALSSSDMSEAKGVQLQSVGKKSSVLSRHFWLQRLEILSRVVHVRPQLFRARWVTTWHRRVRTRSLQWAAKVRGDRMMILQQRRLFEMI